MQIVDHSDAFGADFRQGLQDVGHHDRHGAGGMCGGKADIRILEDDAMCWRHARPPGGSEIRRGGIRSEARPLPADRPDSLFDPDAIAETYWATLNQHRSAWSSEVEVWPWVEKF